MEPINPAEPEWLARMRAEFGAECRECGDPADGTYGEDNHPLCDTCRAETGFCRCGILKAACSSCWTSHHEIHEESEGCYYDKKEAERVCERMDWESFPFEIVRETRTLKCPDGRTLVLGDTGCDHDDGTEELYAEWNDIGIFYYPNNGVQKEHWRIEWNVPTYEEEEGNEDSVPIECVSLSTKASRTPTEIGWVEDLVEKQRALKEALAMVVFHPERVTKMTEAYGDDWMERV